MQGEQTGRPRRLRLQARPALLREREQHCEKEIHRVSFARSIGRNVVIP